MWDLLHCCICSIAVLPTLYPKVEVFVDVRERVETIVALPAVTSLLKALDTHAKSKALPTLYPKVEVFVDVRERVETIMALPAVTLFLKALDTNAESKAL